MRYFCIILIFIIHRPSSNDLGKAVLDGIKAAGGIAKDFGIVSTPQLHYFVVCENTKGEYGKPTIDGYYEKLSGAFNAFREKVIKINKKLQKYVNRHSCSIFGVLKVEIIFFRKILMVIMKRN